MVAEGVSNVSVDTDEFFGVVESRGIELDHFDFVHLLDMGVLLGTLLMVESEGGSSTRSHHGDVVVDLGLTTSVGDEFDVTALRLKDTADGEESLNVFGIDQLLATEDIDEVESLGEHGLGLSVDDTDDWVVCSVHQLSLLDQDSDLRLVPLVHLFECLNHKLVDSSLLIDEVQDDGELGDLLPDLSGLDSFGVFLYHLSFNYANIT